MARNGHWDLERAKQLLETPDQMAEVIGSLLYKVGCLEERLLTAERGWAYSRHLNRNLKERVDTMEREHRYMRDNMAKLPSCPNWNEIRSQTPKIRAMTSFEEVQLYEKVTDTDDPEKLEHIIKIIGQPPDAHGEWTIEWASITAYKKWLLYYYLFFGKLKKRADVTKSCAARSQQVEEALAEGVQPRFTGEIAAGRRHVAELCDSSEEERSPKRARQWSAVEVF
jgi:hypothetical protein